MAQMGTYCRAYQLKDLRAFTKWHEDASALNADADGADGEKSDRLRTGFEDDDVVYLQEDLVVTDGIFKDEQVIFSDITDDWRAFCSETLGFEVPVWESKVDIAAHEPRSQEELASTSETA